MIPCSRPRRRRPIPAPPALQAAALAGLLPLLLAAACSDGAGGEAALDAGEEAVPVRVAEVVLETFRDTARGVGRLEAGETAEIRAQVAALVEGLHFEEGQAVEAGALLVTLDDDVLRRRLSAQRAALRAARATLANLRSDLRRQQQLEARGVGSEAALDRARSEAQAASADAERLRAEVALAARQLEDTRVRAPFAGTVSEREVDVGDLVQPGTLLTTLYRAERLEAVFSVTESEAPAIAAGSPVELRIDGRDPAVAGRVTYVSPAARPGGHDVAVKAELPTQADGLRPGLFLSARVVLDERPDRPSVPERALVGTREGYVVFVVEEGTARRRDVEVGRREVGRVEIRDGVGPGERVVVEGQMRVSDGDRVRVLEAAEPSAPEAARR